MGKNVMSLTDLRDKVIALQDQYKLVFGTWTGNMGLNTMQLEIEVELKSLLLKDHLERWKNDTEDQTLRVS